jgi:AraC-like DNA-binding protein
MGTPYSNLSGALKKSMAIEACGLEWFGFRLPGLRVECHYHFKTIHEDTFTVGLHGHEHWEVSRLVRGGTRFSVVGENETVEFFPGPDCYLMIPPHTTHCWEMTRAPILINSWQIRIEPEDEVGKRLLKCLGEVARKAVYLLPADSYQTAAEDLLWSMASQNLPPSLLGPMVSGVARVVVGSLVGHIQPWPAELNEIYNQRTSSSENLANNIRDFLEANVHNPVTMVDLESHFHYSSRQMNRIFQSNFNVTISQYLRDRRYDLATRWLATTNRSIKDIALSLGFGSASHFCRYFRQLKKLSPTDYRSLAAKPAAGQSFVDNPRSAKKRRCPS